MSTVPHTQSLEGARGRIGTNRSFFSVPVVGSKDREDREQVYRFLSSSDLLLHICKNRIRALIKDAHRDPRSSTKSAHSEKMPVMNQEEGLHQNSTTLVL